MVSLKPLIAAKEALKTLEALSASEEVCYYQLVSIMSHEMREGIGCALYAYSANLDALTLEQEEKVT